MSKYLDRISQDEKSKNKEANKLAEAHAKAEVEQRVSQMKSRAATLEAAYNQALGAVPFNVDKIIKLTEEKSTNEANLKLAEGLLKSEFSA